MHSAQDPLAGLCSHDSQLKKKKKGVKCQKHKCNNFNRYPNEYLVFVWIPLILLKIENLLLKTL